MRHLLAADRVRFGRRHDLWILVAIVPVILAVMYVADFNGVTTPPRTDVSVEPPDPVLEEQLRQEMLAEWRAGLAQQLPAYAFPASLLKVAGNVGPVVLLAIYLATALTAGEFEWGTVRTIHLTSSRGRTLAVRVGVVVGLVAAAVAIALVAGGVLPFLLTAEGVPLQRYSSPVPEFWTEMVYRLAVSLPFIAVPVLMAVLARSVGTAFLLTLLFFVADLAITGAPIWSSSPAPWLPAVTATGSISRLLNGPDTPLAAVAPMAVSFGALLAWAVIPVGLAIARFRRIDLVE